jgi:hypothetical protein
MLSPGEIARIRDEIKRLEEARENCNDGGIRKRIEAWIKEQKQKLESEQQNASSNELDQYRFSCPSQRRFQKKELLAGTNYDYRSD